MTLNDNRNFRLLYYEHLGLHNVEQKKALEQLLSEDPINKDKLKIFRYARLQTKSGVQKCIFLEVLNHSKRPKTSDTSSWNGVESKDLEISGGKI